MENQEIEVQIDDAIAKRMTQLGLSIYGATDFGSNVDTKRKLYGVGKSSGVSFYAVMDRSPTGSRLVALVDQFDKAAVETCEAGNYHKGPFVLQRNGKFQLYTHKGGQHGKQVGTLKEVLKPFKRLGMLAKTPSDAEAELNKKDYYDRRYAGHAEMLEAHRIEEEALNRKRAAHAKEREAWAESSGFGAW